MYLLVFTHLSMMNRELYTHISTHLYSRYFEKLIYISVTIISSPRTDQLFFSLFFILLLPWVMLRLINASGYLVANRSNTRGFICIHLRKLFNLQWPSLDDKTHYGSISNFLHVNPFYITSNFDTQPFDAIIF